MDGIGGVGLRFPKVRIMKPKRLYFTTEFNEVHAKYTRSFTEFDSCKEFSTYGGWSSGSIKILLKLSIMLGLDFG